MNKILFLLLLMLIATEASLAQNKNLSASGVIDSLQTLLKKDAEDTNKVIHLNALSWELKNSDPDTAVFLLNQALVLSENLQWKKGISKSLGQLGVSSWLQADYNKALDYFLKALKIDEELKDKSGIAKHFVNIGLVYWNQGDYPKALNYYFRALKTYEELGKEKNIAIVFGNIGLVYWNQGEYSKALDYYFKALKITEDLGDKNEMGRHLMNIGNVYKDQGDYLKGIDYYFKALKINEETGNKNLAAIVLGNIGIVYFKIKNSTKALEYSFKSLKMSEELDDKIGIARQLGNIGEIYTKTGNFKEAERYLKRAIALEDSIGAMDELRQMEESLSVLYDTTAQLATGTSQYEMAAENYRHSLIQYKKSIVLKDSLFNQEKNKEITKNEMNYEFDKKEAATKAEQDKKDALTQHQMQKQKIIRNSFVGGFALVLLFSIVVFGQKKKITKEKKRSDELLLNILPSEVAEELKLNGESEAKQFDDVTVLLTDFVNFTGASEKLTPKELVGEIHQCFTAFDEIIGRNGLEKIKTTGDAYLAVCGLPNVDEQHAKKTVTAAQEILRFMNERKKTSGLKYGFGEMRIGINSGSVVAGIVGVKKFAYDIWGDTVNIAARMEQNCEAGKINISGTTYELVKDQFTCTHRGKIKAKNKGEIDMYFVEQLDIN